MKVAFIVSKFPCYDEAFILREIDALSKRLEIAIVSLRKSKEKVRHDEAEALLSKTIYVPYLFSLKILATHFHVFLMHPIRYLRAFFRLMTGNIKSPEFFAKSLVFFPKAVYLAKWMMKEKITHIHAYWATYPASVALVISEITKIPFSFTGHAHDIYLDTTHLKEKIVQAQFVTTCTQQNKEHLVRVIRPVPGTVANKGTDYSLSPFSTARNVPGTDCKIVVIHHGLDLSKFKTNGKVRNKTFEILSVGTLQYHKGFQYLIPALGILRDKGLDFKCTIIGGGLLESDLRRHIRLLDLEGHVTMTGPLKQKEVFPYYKRADLLVLMAQPEWHWGIPNVLIEALAAKAAVITTRFGSVEELVKDGETGLIVPPKDPGALADTIERLYRDDALKIRLAQAGYEFVVRNFDLNKNIEIFQRKLAHENLPLAS